MRMIIFFVSALVAFVQSQTYTKFQYSLCHTSTPAFTIQEMDLSPIPILLSAQGSQATGVIKATGTRGANYPFIDKVLRVQVTLVRKIQGLALDIRCFLVTGEYGPQYVGSCTYEDTCKTMEAVFSWKGPGECSQFLLDAGIECSCPFNFPKNYVNVEPTSFSVSNLAANPYFSPFIVGDLDINVKMTDGPTLANNKNYFGCLDIKVAFKRV